MYLQLECRPKTSRNERKRTERGASKGEKKSPFSGPGGRRASPGSGTASSSSPVLRTGSRPPASPAPRTLRSPSVTASRRAATTQPAPPVPPFTGVLFFFARKKRRAARRVRAAADGCVRRLARRPRAARARSVRPRAGLGARRVPRLGRRAGAIFRVGSARSSRRLSGDGPLRGELRPGRRHGRRRPRERVPPSPVPPFRRARPTPAWGTA